MYGLLTGVQRECSIITKYFLRRQEAMHFTTNISLANLGRLSEIVASQSAIYRESICTVGALIMPCPSKYASKLNFKLNSFQ